MYLHGQYNFVIFRRPPDIEDDIPPIAIFYHLGLVGTYSQRNARIMFYLNESKLLDYCKEFYVVVVGNTTANPLPQLPTQATIIDGGTNLEKFEGPTISLIYKFARKYNNFYILYIHDKGATHPLDNQAVYDWIELLLFFNVHHWRAAIKYLANYKVVCINFSIERDSPHCSGNFWWARADYIKTLIVPPPNPERHFYEFWIGTKLTRDIQTLFRSNYANQACILWPETLPHYSKEFPPEKYNHVKNPQCILTYPSCQINNTRCRLPPNINF